MDTEAPLHARIYAPYLRTLRRAVEVAGGEAALAAAWQVPQEQLSLWLAGERLLPVRYYLAALDLVHGRQPD